VKPITNIDYARCLIMFWVFGLAVVGLALNWSDRFLVILLLLGILAKP
jgi:hypothetical protein